jgi:hypothetical protein
MLGPLLVSASCNPGDTAHVARRDAIGFKFGFNPHTSRESVEVGWPRPGVQ